MCAIAASVGLSLFQGLAMRSAATQAAEDTAEIERQGNTYSQVLCTLVTQGLVTVLHKDNDSTNDAAISEQD